MTRPPPVPDAEVARRALPLLDLTDLSETCTAGAVEALARAADAAGVAALCVWPRFVHQAATALRDSPVRVATVVNFPHGADSLAAVCAETRAALADGADEIDLVMPYGAYLRGETKAVRETLSAVRTLCAAPCVLKVILETGELGPPERIAAAAQLALASGADFVKTSTGKSPVSATPEAAVSMLGAIRDHGRGGLKVSGGLRTVDDARTYLAAADRIMGPGWVRPETVRLGASALLAVLQGAVRDAR